MSPIESGSADLLAKLQRCGETDDVPEGWKTSAQLREEWKMSETNTLRLIAKGIKNGVLEKKKFRIQLENRTLPVYHYKEV